MNGPILSMAPALDTSLPFHRSRSSPELLSDLPDSPSTGALTLPHDSDHAVSSPTGHHRPLDLPSFDFDHDFQAALSLDRDPGTLKPSGSGRAVEIKPVAPDSPDAAPASDSDEKLSRSRSMIDRSRLWLPNARTSPEGRARAAGKAPARPTGECSGPEFKPPERSSTVESLAGFAKRSWMSSSRSPSPRDSSDRKAPLSGEPSDGGASVRPQTAGKTRSSMLSPLSLSGAGSRRDREPREHRARGSGSLDRNASRSSDSLSSTSRAFSRAGMYLSRIRQRRQSVLSARSVSSPALQSSSPGAPGSSGAPGPPLPDATTSAADEAATTESNSLQSHHNFLCPRDSSNRASTCTSDAGTSSEDASQSTADTALTMPHPTSQDPLWAAFRNLEADFARFAAKASTSAKMGAVRSILVPFLQNTARHPSNADKRLLAPEDVDRRATILGKWWNGLLEVLDSGHSRAGFGVPFASSGAENPPQPVAGVDRPVLLEAMTMVMMRPEWRLSTTYFQPLAHRSPFERVRRRASADGDSGQDLSDSAFIVQSAEHNVRTMFVTNLLAQMAIAVDRMSMRHAPLSLVNWAGKACAYAFFFVPGVADVLVRLWGLRPDLIRRAADEFGLPRRSVGESEDITALFPPAMGGLGWASVKAAAGKLRLAAKLPLLAAKIPWHGPWVSRWRGGDTDLLFIFSKYYHIMADEFMPAGLPLVEKARAPAFVLLHAQLLAVLDSTVHRHAALEAMLGSPLADAFQPADVPLAALSPPANNLLRGMDENRLIVLLKDMLSDHVAGVSPDVKLSFAEAFMALLKGAARRTSRYDHAACYMLCDFLEEALVACDDFQDSLGDACATPPREQGARAPARRGTVGGHPQQLVDWTFWLGVAKLILNTNNTMAEIRMLSFVFAIWDSVTADPARREAVCRDWLLSEEIFARFFTNWCPMVRAYYMRLLCWRICRGPGRAGEPDAETYLLVSERLRTIWSHYLWLKQKADAGGRLQPSTAPSLPAPGKRFMIVRTESQPPQPGVVMGFDQPSSAFASPDAPTATHRAPPPGNSFPGVSSTSTDDSQGQYKKRWSLLGRMLSLTVGTPTAADSSEKCTWDDDELEESRRETAASRMMRAGVQFLSGPPPLSKEGAPPTTAASSDSGSSTGSAPIYEPSQYVFRFTLAWHNQAAGPPRDRILTSPRLPAPAQACISARMAALSGRAAANGEPAAGGGAARGESPLVTTRPPLPTRRSSSLAQQGLVSEARNARPLADEAAGRDARRPLAPAPRTGSEDPPGAATGDLPTASPPPPGPPRPGRDLDWTSGAAPARSRSSESSGSEDGFDLAAEAERLSNRVRPTQPAGVHAAGATYAGRALAEWSLVVNECNSFVDRRRDEGVLGLGDVEVPILSVEGLGLRRPA